MKTKIAALITALLIIFIGAGGVYYISQTSPQVQGIIDSVDESSESMDELPVNQSVRYIEDQTDTRVEDWLKQIGQEFGLTTLNISDGSFVWASDVGEEEILGQAIIFDGTLDINNEKIVEQFQRNGFEINAEQENGYIKEDLACLVKSTSLEDGVAELEETEIRCGLIDLEKDIIKKLFFESDEKRDINNILIDIVQSTPDHMSGNVQFVEPGPSGDASAQDSVETFLAAYVEEKWVLVFYGNEKILCGDIEPYNFPLEMLPECFDETLNEMVNRTQ